MALDCLTTSVQLRGCGTNSPAPLLFVNALPGISLKSIEFLADSEQQTYIGVWNDIVTRAKERFRLSVQSALNTRYKLKTISSTYDLGRDIDSTSTTGAASEYRGVEFDMDKGISPYYKNSALSSHWVQTVSIYSGSTYTTTLKVLDADLETELHSQSVELTAGWNTVTVNQHFEAHRIVVAYNASTEASVELAISPTIKYVYEGVSVSGGYYTTSTGVSSWTETGNSYGLSVKYSLRCRYDNLVCSNVDLFAVPFWYLCGSEYMMERMTSERVNKFTVDKKQAELNYQYYEEKFQDTLRLAVDGIDICEDACVDCGGTYQIIEQLP